MFGGNYTKQRQENWVTNCTKHAVIRSYNIQFVYCKNMSKLSWWKEIDITHNDKLMVKCQNKIEWTITDFSPRLNNPPSGPKVEYAWE